MPLTPKNLRLQGNQQLSPPSLNSFVGAAPLMLMLPSGVFFSCRFVFSCYDRQQTNRTLMEAFRGHFGLLLGMSLMESPDGGGDCKEHRLQDPPPAATPTQQDNDDDYIPDQWLGVFQNIYNITEWGVMQEYDPAEDP